MAKDRTIHIIGGIGEWSNSIQYIQYCMDELGDGPITVKCTSTGGNLNDALAIKQMFAEHGNVTVEYIGFNASAATIIGHGAVKTRIMEDSFYLIHKPELAVNINESMNEDELAEAITELTAQKKDAETVTLIIVQDYVKSLGMDSKTVIDLMKEARWLSAKEAVDLGLVDELIPTKNKKAVLTNKMVAMMKANGLPVPVQSSEPNQNPEWFDAAREFFTKKNKAKMNKENSFVNSVLGVEGFELKENKVFLSQEDLAKINAELKTKSDAIASMTTERDSAVTAQTNAENALTAFTDKVNELDPAVAEAPDADAKVNAIKEKLASRPAAAPASPQGGNGGESITDSVDWNAIDNLPHNQLADHEV